MSPGTGDIVPDESVELAEGGLGRDFPRSWGPPPGDRFSEERGVWVRAKVRAHMLAEPHRQLARRAGRMLAYLRLAEIRSRRTGP